MMKDALQSDGSLLSSQVSGKLDSWITAGIWCPNYTALAILMWLVFIYHSLNNCLLTGRT